MLHLQIELKPNHHIRVPFADIERAVTAWATELIGCPPEDVDYDPKDSHCGSFTISFAAASRNPLSVAFELKVDLGSLAEQVGTQFINFSETKQLGYRAAGGWISVEENGDVLLFPSRDKEPPRQAR